MVDFAMKFSSCFSVAIDFVELRSKLQGFKVARKIQIRNLSVVMNYFVHYLVVCCKVEFVVGIGR